MIEFIFSKLLDIYRRQVRRTSSLLAGVATPNKGVVFSRYMANKKLYNVIETGKLLGIGKAKVYELIKYGYLPALDLGGLKIPDTAIDKFIASYTGCSFKNIAAVSQLDLAQ